MAKTKIVANWLTLKPNPSAIFMTAAMAFLIVTVNTFFWYPASGTSVFIEHQYWRVVTALFAHGDLGHLLSNCLLYLPLTFLMAGYFSLWFFPISAWFVGAVINILVLTTLPPEVKLMGMSGVVYWMGAAWLTLFMLIDRRRSLRFRFAVAIFVTAMLFMPEKYQASVSYLSHFLGFIFGTLSATIYYFFNREKFLATEITVPVIDEDSEPRDTTFH
jgi:rhomboid protease GluP